MQKENLYAFYLTVAYGYSVDRALQKMGIKLQKTEREEISLTDDELMNMLHERNEGKSYIELSYKLGVSSAWVYEMLKRFADKNGLYLRYTKQKKECANV
jgi:transposase